MQKPILVAEKLFKTYGDQVAVDGLGFEIIRGETFGLLGPNGAGKTTTISMLVGLLRPDSGVVHVCDENGAQTSPLTPAVRQRIGVAPQSLSLYDDLTARENLEFFGRLYGLSGRELTERVNWSLDFAGLADRQRGRVGTFSGGMKRRINIAVALIHDPEILLLDEPTVGVDPQSRNHIFECIQSLQQAGLTILYTTHYMEEAQRLCDRVAIVDRGKLLALDGVTKLINQSGGASIVTCQCAGALAEIDQSKFELPGIRSPHFSASDAVTSEIRFESDRPLEHVAELTARGLTFQSLNVAQPNLESVFLNLTGRSLRD